MLFARTVRAFTLGPAKLSRAWANGELRPMNPLGYLSLCLLWQVPLQFALSWRMRDETEREAHLFHLSAESYEIYRAAAPYLLPLVLCLLLHPFLKLLGSRRRLRTTIGIFLFKEGPGLLLSYLAAPFRHWALGHPAEVAHRLKEYVDLLESLPVFAYVVVGLAAAHGLRAWRSALAVMLTFVAIAILSTGVALLLLARH